MHLHLVPSCGRIAGCADSFQCLFERLPIRFHRTDVMSNIFAKRHELGWTEASEIHIRYGCRCATATRGPIVPEGTETSAGTRVREPPRHYAARKKNWKNLMEANDYFLTLLQYIIVLSVATIGLQRDYMNQKNKP